MPDRFLRPEVDVPVRPTRRVALPKRKPDALYPYPDTIREAARAFFWRRPLLEFAVIALVMGAAGFCVMWWILL